MSERIRRELSSRSHALPAWIYSLEEVAPYRAVEMVHVLGDGDDVMIGVRLPGGKELTITVYIDHNLGSVVKDAFVVPEPLADLVAFTNEQFGDDAVDVTWNDLPLADARVRVTEAIERGAITFPPYESESWPACRPLVEWIVRLLPQGGRGYDRPEWDEHAQEELGKRFLASSFATELHADEDYAELLESLLWFGCDYGPGDPLHWSPVAVEILLADWIPRKIVAPVAVLEKAPKLLRSFISFAHEERGIRAGLTDETLRAVDRWEPGYQEAIRSDRPQGPMAILDAMGVLESEDAVSDPTDPEGNKRGRAPKRSRPKLPPDVAGELGDSFIVGRFQLLVDFFGDGRKLTQTGNPTLADARTLVSLLGTADRMDERIGDRTLKTRSASDLPELMFTIRWAIAAGALRKEHGKLRATFGWRKLSADPAERWARAADSLPELGPVATFFADARYRDPDEIVDEVADHILASLLVGPLEWEQALDMVCDHAEATFEWTTPFMQAPENRRRSFEWDLDTLVTIMSWAGIVDRVGATAEPDQWDPDRERPKGGTLHLTEPGRWWLESTFRGTA